MFYTGWMRFWRTFTYPLPLVLGFYSAYAVAYLAGDFAYAIIKDVILWLAAHLDNHALR